MIDLSTFKNITDFENYRNELIKSIDNVNFITKYGRDVKIEKENITKNTYKLDGTTDEQRKVNFYSNYSNCIEHIKKNTEKMYSKLDTSINFLNIQYTFEIAVGFMVAWKSSSPNRAISKNKGVGSPK
jgi:hypothetical protein